MSSAKAALESHIRQLAMELARSGIGATANCIRAGVTVTPALLKIPESQTMIDITMKRNPTGRMTTPQDVANAILALSGDGTEFINGDIISVDGGEFVTGVLTWTARVIVVGSVNIDLVTTVDRLPAPGETVTGGRFARHHGGKGGNQAVAAARLGARDVVRRRGR